MAKKQSVPVPRTAALLDLLENVIAAQFEAESAEKKATG